MAKVHFHYKHIIILFLFLLCFAVLGFIIVHDLFLKEDSSEKVPVNPNDASGTFRKDSRNDVIIQDVLRSPVIPRVEPKRETIEPIRQRYEPIRERIEPIRQRYEPIRERIEPIRQRYESIRERIEPIRERIEPIRERIESIREIIEPVREKIEPIQEKITPTREKIEPILETINSRMAESPLIKLPDPIPQKFDDPVEAVPSVINRMQVEEDTLETLNRFVQSRQLGRVNRVLRDDYYVAAVVDFQPLAVGDILTKVRWNVDQYVEIINECVNYMVDVIVFPELGIFSILDSLESILMIAPQIPSVQDEVVPCDVRQYDEILTKLSCAAKMGRMYVAATMMEKFCLENTTCSIGNLRVYLTTLVFDRDGKIIAKYRKYNLYVERFLPGINVPLQPELVTFTSDFNVTFGLITGFDIFFIDPGVSLTEKYNVTDIIFPNSLPTRLPFLAVSSVAAGWSYVRNVNVLSSKNSDLLGMAGNNIYYGRREFSQTYIMNRGFSSVVVAPVPRHDVPFPRDFADSFVSLMKYSNRNLPISQLREHALTSIKMEPLVNAKKDHVRIFKYINKEFFCNVSITWEPTVETFLLPGYRMAGFNGLTNYTLSSINNYVEMCGLILCSSFNTFTCMLPPLFDDSSKASITSMKIIAASRLAIDDIRIPITLSSDYTVLDPSYYEFSNVIKIVDDEKYNIAEITLRKPVSKLITFGIYKFPEKIQPASEYSVLDAVLNANTILG